MDDLILQQNFSLQDKSYEGVSGTSLVGIHLGAQFSLRISPTDLPLAASAFGAPIPDEIGQMVRTGQSLALCLGPDEWQLMVPVDLVNPLEKNFEHLQVNTPHALVDISHRHEGIQISGPLATKIISGGCPIDLENLPVGMCARTILDKVQIVVQKFDTEHYQLQLVRSFTPYAWRFMQTIARQYEAELAQDLT